METERKTENAGREDDQKDVTLFKLSMRDLSNVTLVLPLSGLFVCLITGYVLDKIPHNISNLLQKHNAFL